MMTKKLMFVCFIVLLLGFAFWWFLLVNSHIREVHPSPTEEVKEQDSSDMPSLGDEFAKATLVTNATMPPVEQEGFRNWAKYISPLSDEDVVSIAIEVFPFEVDESQLADKATVMREEGIIRVFLPEVSIQRLPKPIGMEAVIDADTATVLDADLFCKSINTVCDAEWDVKVSDEEALLRAKSAIGKSKYNEILKIRIEHLDGNIIRVVFPFSGWRADTGYFYPGPDYAVEVLIDANSGEVLRVSG